MLILGRAKGVTLHQPCCTIGVTGRQLWGLPVKFALFAIITVIVTGGSMKVFGGAIMDPALFALAISGALSIGLSLLGAFGLMFNVGDWGCLIGSAAGAVCYVAFNPITVPAGSMSTA